MTDPKEQPPAPETAELDTSKLVSTTKPEDLPPADPAKLAQETTPVADSVNAPTDSASSDEEEEDEVDPTGAAPATAKSYQVDISRALQRETHDGKGDEDPGPSDWNGYATDGVEAQETTQ